MKNQKSTPARSDNDSFPETYDEKIRMEAAFWGRECSRPRGVSDNPVNIWDDPDVESIMRGEYLNFIIQKASEKQGNRVLECGCGGGWLSLEVARRGIRVDGYDLSPPLIQLAKEKASGFRDRPGFKPPAFAIQDLNKIVLEPDTYDAVMIWDALHHIQEAERLLTEVKKGLKKGGSLVMVDHVREPCFSGKLFSLVFQLILPTDVTYRTKWKQVFARLTNRFRKPRPAVRPSDGAMNGSPFEDITGIEMVGYIDELFTIQKKTFFMSFSHHFAARIRMRNSIRFPLIRFFKRLDDFLIRARLSKGEYVFILAVKR